MAVVRQALLVQVFVGLLDEVAQQAAPGFGDGRQARADDL